MEFDGTLGRHPRDYGWSERMKNTEEGFMIRYSYKILDTNEFINFFLILEEENKTIGDEGITVDFRFIKVHTSN